jgi:alpha-amylase/alpha-mannosidase (GH57 family)
LRDEAAREFEAAGAELFADPWVARNGYIEIILDPRRSGEDFLKDYGKHPDAQANTARALNLLEMQRNALLMYASCGWFFSELSGIETVQMMKYAARVMELMDQLGLASPRATFLEMIAEARSNIPELGTGADIYLRLAEPTAELARS